TRCLSDWSSDVCSSDLNQKTINPKLLKQISGHGGSLLLHFPIDSIQEKQRLVKFTDALKRSGGFAMKIDSAGISHEWDSWFSARSEEHTSELQSLRHLV